jgi:hypothetical protein
VWCSWIICLFAGGCPFDFDQTLRCWDALIYSFSYNSEQRSTGKKSRPDPVYHICLSILDVNRSEILRCKRLEDVSLVTSLLLIIFKSAFNYCYDSDYCFLNEVYGFHASWRGLFNLHLESAGVCRVLDEFPGSTNKPWFKEKIFFLIQSHHCCIFENLCKVLNDRLADAEKNVLEEITTDMFTSPAAESRKPDSADARFQASFLNSLDFSFSLMATLESLRHNHYSHLCSLLTEAGSNTLFLELIRLVDHFCLETLSTQGKVKA